MTTSPDTGTSKIEVPAASNEPPDEDGDFLNLYRFTTVRGHCQPPAISARRKDGADDEGVWQNPPPPSSDST
jgi:hypothetical protein